MPYISPPLLPPGNLSRLVMQVVLRKVHIYASEPARKTTGRIGPQFESAFRLFPFAEDAARLQPHNPETAAPLDLADIVPSVVFFPEARVAHDPKPSRNHRCRRPQWPRQPERLP